MHLKFICILWQNEKDPKRIFRWSKKQWPMFNLVIISPIWQHLPSYLHEMKGNPWLSFDTGHPAATKPLCSKQGEVGGKANVRSVSEWWLLKGRNLFPLADSGESGFRGSLRRGRKSGFRAASSSPGCAKPNSFLECCWIHRLMQLSFGVWGRLKSAVWCEINLP